ncbi:MAG: hypothetical protein JWL83_3000 [Actinomycetia bacterium]|nr:hypothetical protein [Actinomycetes bacterium]
MAHLSNWDIVGRLALAVLVGGAIGFERETDGQDAGIRTHMMLALGAAVFGVISVGAWDHFQTQTSNSIFRVDVTRVASYVAAGIGFVGGGAILKHAGTVTGLTTAASLWVAGAVGLSAGVGFWLPAVAGTVLASLALMARFPLRRLVAYVSARRTGRVTILLDRDGDPSRVVDLLRSLPDKPTNIEIGTGENEEQLEIAVRFVVNDADRLMTLAGDLAGLDDVREVNVGRY